MNVALVNPRLWERRQEGLGRVFPRRFWVSSRSLLIPVLALSIFLLTRCSQILVCCSCRLIALRYSLSSRSFSKHSNSAFSFAAFAVASMSALERPLDDCELAFEFCDVCEGFFETLDVCYRWDLTLLRLDFSDDWLLCIACTSSHIFMRHSMYSRSRTSNHLYDDSLSSSVCRRLLNSHWILCSSSLRRSSVSLSASSVSILTSAQSRNVNMFWIWSLSFPKAEFLCLVFNSIANCLPFSVRFRFLIVLEDCGESFLVTKHEINDALSSSVLWSR